MTRIASLRAGCALFVLAFGGFATRTAWAETIRGRIVERERYSFLLRGGVQVHF